MITTFLLYFFAFICGAGNKYADLFNEHGLPLPYKHAEKVWGVIWGVAGGFLVYSDSTVAMIYIATTLYWFLRIKLEFFNHALAGVIMLLVGYLYQGDYIIEHKSVLILLFLAFTITGYAQKYLKESNLNLWWLWRLRIRIYAIPLIYSYFVDNYTPFFVTVVAMLGNELVRYYFKNYENDVSLTKKDTSIRKLISPVSGEHSG